MTIAEYRNQRGLGLVLVGGLGLPCRHQACLQRFAVGLDLSLIVPEIRNGFDVLMTHYDEQSLIVPG
jgi:hypothetical protein